MAGKRAGTYYFSLTILSLAMGVLSFSGLLIHADLPGRIIMGSAWSIVCAGWAAQLIRVMRMKE